MEEMRKWIVLICNSRMSNVMSAVQLIDQQFVPLAARR